MARIYRRAGHVRKFTAIIFNPFPKFASARSTPRERISDKQVCEVVRFRRVSTILRQVLTEFSDFFECWVFHKEISRQDRLATTIANSVDPQHPHFGLPSRAFRCLFPPEAVPDWKLVC